MSRIRLLAIDNDRQLLDFLSQRLQKSQYSVAHIAPGDSVISQVRENHSPDLILISTCSNFHGKSLEKLCSTLSTFGIPVLLFAEKANEKLTRFLKKTNASGYILEKFNQAELMTAIDFALTHFTREKDYQQTANILQVLAAEASDIFWVTDLVDLKTNYSSPAIEKMLGYTPEEDMATPIEKKYTPQSLALIRKTLAEELAREQEVGVDLDRSSTLELQQYHKNGSAVWTEVKVRFLRDVNKKPIGLIGVTRDISDRKSSEKRLKESEQRFKDFAFIASDYFWELDAELRYSYISEHYQKFTCIDPKTLLGKTRQALYRDLIPEEKHLWTHLFSLLDSHKPFKNFIYSFIRPDGKKRILLNHGMPFFDENNKFIGYRGVGSDITSLHEAQIALAEKSSMLDNILKTAIDFGIVTTDLEYRITYYNPAAEKIFGYKPDEVLGKTVDELHARENAAPEKFRQAIEKLPEQGEYKYAYERNTKNGMRSLEGRLCGIYNPQGKITGYSLFITDVTERKNAERIMLKASRMEATATLAAGIAHDFNNLMVGVLGNADLLKMQFQHEPEVMDMLDSIASSASQAGQLAQQMLSFARGGKYQPTNLNLNEILRQVLKRDKHIFPPRIRLETNLQKNLWIIHADPTQIGQIVMNLCLNAVEAIKNNGVILIETKNIEIETTDELQRPGLMPGKHIQLCVCDNGQGMTNSTAARVFEPFFSTKFQGRGLGLAAVYGIVKNHDGCIFVDSEPAKGARFSVYFPIAEQQIDERIEPDTQLPHGTETILLIDDESLILDISVRILNKFGYKTIIAENGQEAVKIARKAQSPIHLAVLDMGMPILGGAEAFPHLIEAQPDMKVIICSGYELDKAARALLDRGATSFLQKPFSAENLVISVRTALDS